MIGRISTVELLIQNGADPTVLSDEYIINYFGGCSVENIGRCMRVGMAVLRRLPFFSMDEFELRRLFCMDAMSDVCWDLCALSLQYV